MAAPKVGVREPPQTKRKLGARIVTQPYKGASTLELLREKTCSIAARAIG